MEFSVVSEGALLALRSDVMLVAAAAAVIGAHVAGAAVRRRAFEPALPWRAAFVSGGHDQFRAVRGALRIPGRAGWTIGPAVSAEDDPQRVARVAVTMVASAGLGLIGALALVLSGHAPSPLAVIGLAGIATIAAVLTAMRISWPLATRSVLSRRGARLLASSAFAQASSAMALVIAVVVVLNAAGLTAVSVAEVAAITLATRLAISVTPWPGGLGVADVTLLVPLVWIGVPIDVGAAVVLIWRAGSLLAVTAAIVAARHPRAAAARRTGPPTSDWGRPLHRGLFGLVGLLPGRVRDTIRRTVFDAMFAVSDDPWGYQEMAYERRKREHLLAAVGDDVTVVVEVGSADGHNLVALASQLPDAVIVGTDISRTAVAVAQERTRALGTVTVLHTDQQDLLAASVAGRVDCVVLAEVLYYLGSERAMRVALGRVRELMQPGCRVVLVHGAADGERLHESAARALGLRMVSSRHVEDPERPYVVSIAGADD